MNINLPWLSSRVYLFIFCFIDILLFIFLGSFYKPIFNNNYLSNISLIFCSLFVLLTTSYICGRYLIERRKKKLIMLKFLFIRSLRFALLIILFFSLLKNFSFIEYNYINIIQFVLAFISLSFVCQLIIQFSIFKDINNPKRWIFIGSTKYFNDLKNHIQKSSLKNSSFILMEFAENGLSKSIINKIENSDYGLIIGDEFNLSDNEKIIIYNMKTNGALILTGLKWCINFLQSVPSSILSDEDILRNEFLVDCNSISMRIKRLADVIFSILLLGFLSPIILLSAILIYSEDSGSVFYSQLRNGYKGEKFRIWKLRTMKENAELNGVLWAKNDDPRITNIGKFLRKMRIDELPQLISVINGKMSLIGPRPERPEFDKILENKINHYKIRQYIKPGLSGWAQVNYPYGASVEDASFKLSFDLYYLQNFSNLLDMLIFFKTIRLVFNLKGSIPIKKN